MRLVPMDHHEKTRLRTAVAGVTRLYPGQVGELVSRELLSWEDWEEFGLRLGGSRLVLRLVEDVLQTPLGHDGAAARVGRQAGGSGVAVSIRPARPDGIGWSSGPMRAHAQLGRERGEAQPAPDTEAGPLPGGQSVASVDGVGRVVG